VLETNDPDALRAELTEALSVFETSRALPREEARGEVIAELGELMIDSPHVEEVFADDELLHRVIAAALLDFARSLARAPRRTEEDVAALFAAVKPTKRVTLADEGFEFPLFEGTRSDAILDERGPCKACRAEAPTRFEAHCYTCFREGLALATRDTERGMVRPEDAEAGLTHGTYAEPKDVEGLDVVLAEEDDDGHWYRFKFARAGLEELIRTPDYHSAQGSSWLFCCGQPMVFLGTVDDTLLTSLAADGQKTSTEVLSALLGIDDDAAEEVLDDALSQRISVYAFRCRACSKKRAYSDRT